MSTLDSISLRAFAVEIANSIRCNPALQYRWVTAELSDVSVKGGHCYMELIEKDARGMTVARMRGTIWANNFAGRIKPKFERITGETFRSGLKVMLYGCASFHEQYGLSFNISDIDPSFTLGDMERLRREIIETLTKEGVAESNKKISMPLAPQRIAVVSASSAAGYGDFMNQLNNNPVGFKFYTHLFEASMQGGRTAASVIDALRRIEMSIDLWDCVVIIRGGGATSDLNGFDNLELAREVATFALPIVVGIGHERDRTVLDDIANTRVKTPTAAAEWLVMQAQQTLDTAISLVQQVANHAKQLLSGAMQQLSYQEASIPAIAQHRVTAARNNLTTLTAAIPHLASARILSANRRIQKAGRDIQQASISKSTSAHTYLKVINDTLKTDSRKAVQMQNRRLNSLSELIHALSPEKTLRRGYSITTVGGKAVKSASLLTDKAEITTIFADGKIKAIVNKIN